MNSEEKLQKVLRGIGQMESRPVAHFDDTFMHKLIDYISGNDSLDYDSVGDFLNRVSSGEWANSISLCLALNLCKVYNGKTDNKQFTNLLPLSRLPQFWELPSIRAAYLNLLTHHPTLDQDIISELTPLLPEILQSASETVYVRQMAQKLLKRLHKEHESLCDQITENLIAGLKSALINKQEEQLATVCDSLLHFENLHNRLDFVLGILTEIKVRKEPFWKICVVILGEKEDILGNLLEQKWKSDFGKIIVVRECFLKGKFLLRENIFLEILLDFLEPNKAVQRGSYSTIICALNALKTLGTKLSNKSFQQSFDTVSHLFSLDALPVKLSHHVTNCLETMLHHVQDKLDIKIMEKAWPAVLEKMLVCPDLFNNFVSLAIKIGASNLVSQIDVGRCVEMLFLQSDWSTRDTVAEILQHLIINCPGIL